MLNLIKRLTRPSPSSAASTLAKEGARQRKLRIRAKCDEMRAAMGQPPIEWPAL